ncbi:MAG: FkbM family methyltransferase [Betaproteobacteria bacterium]|nr:FkbM family methyltransferase [Betaproteobacteria bacterium]
MLISFKHCADLYKQLYGSSIREVLHVGGNTGEELTCYVSNGVSRSLWFEPNPLVFPTLVQNCLNTAGTHVALQFALSDKNAESELFIANNFQSSSLFQFEDHLTEHPSVHYMAKCPVRVRSFDSMSADVYEKLPSFSPQFVNLDIQGSEYSALQGMLNLLRESVSMIYCEVNMKKLYAGIKLVGDIDKLLEQSNFVRILTSWTEHGWGDSVYIKKVENF